MTKRIPATKQIKVRVALTVVVDVDDYVLNYGPVSDDTIRSDVRSVVLDAVTNREVLHDGIVSAWISR